MINTIEELIKKILDNQCDSKLTMMKPLFGSPYLELRNGYRRDAYQISVDLYYHLRDMTGISSYNSNYFERTDIDLNANVLGYVRKQKIEKILKDLND